jgi:Ca-activated chloride channel family protein
MRYILFALKVILLALLIIMLARPQTTNYWEDRTTEGIDIVIALDISSSMLARDFVPNRLEASKDVAISFISGRPNDRMGLVVFSGESFTQCPLTTDHAVLINLFKDIKQGMIEDGTAIGMGLANAVNRLKDSDTKSKVIILLTDGVNNMGAIDPITAAQLAKSFGIRVYTIGVGKNGYAPYPVQTMFGIQYQDMEVKIDEETLKKISEITDGKYFRATNNRKLKQIYKEIDKLEKSKIQVKKFSSKNDEFMPLAQLAVFLLSLIILIRYTIMRNIP